MTIFQIFGTALLGLGIWLIADLSSLISLLKLASKDQIRVKTDTTYFLNVNLMFVIGGDGRGNNFL